MIRNYTPNDYAMLCEWWKAVGMDPPSKGMLPMDTTYLVDNGKVSMASACLYLMNTREAAMVEHVIGNPAYKGEERKRAVKELINHIESVAKQYGYKVLVVFSYLDKVKERYEQLGFKNTLNNVSTFAKQI